MKACVILNPAAGPGDFHRHLSRAISHLQTYGWQVDRRETEQKGDATRLARQAADTGYDVAIAVGGDGTINEVANGLVGTCTALGVIPSGTANVYAADVGIPIWGPLRPQAVEAAAEIIHTGRRCRIDLGHVQFADGQQRHFFMWCGVGLDAAVTREVTSEHTRRLGMAAWVIASVLVAVNFMGTAGRVVVDGRSERKRVLWAVISNGQLYGRLWRIAPAAKMDDGRLDMTVFEGHDVLSTIRHMAGLVFGRSARDPTVHQYQGCTITIRTRTPLPVHVDAEPLGTTPVRVKVVPQALDVILPRKLPLHLLTQTGD
jgi:diacylglycerol kinase (ATP)